MNSQKRSLLHLLRDLGKGTVTGHFAPTRKNELVQEFWEQQSFSVMAEGTYLFNLEHLPERKPALDYFVIQLIKENL